MGNTGAWICSMEEIRIFFHIENETFDDWVAMYNTDPNVPRIAKK